MTDEQSEKVTLRKEELAEIAAGLALGLKGAAELNAAASDADLARDFAVAGVDEVATGSAESAASSMAAAAPDSADDAAQVT